ncbi:hypothetical protein HK097_009936 [Rhizophlyctis rosea]|uniref:UspA domain-containing protein n=1 Tax=Rhizophlyctis rosea TaxID=64517 RepID=A0AAD5SKR7_9FUNG|nr:hypothetical protein HK097_009936 [Rhizophlyctis rosea]
MPGKTDVTSLATSHTTDSQSALPPAPDFGAQRAQQDAHANTQQLEAVVAEHVHPEAEESSGEGRIERVVVVALDHSKNSDKAFHWALDNFLNPKKDLLVLLNVRSITALPGGFGSAYMDYSEYYTQMDEKARSDAHHLLQYYAAAARQNKVRRAFLAVKAIAMRGDPRDELVRKAKEVNADAVILGSRGMGAWRRAVLGSVSDHCIHHLACPVIVIKDNDPSSDHHTAKTDTAKSTSQASDKTKSTPPAGIDPQLRAIAEQTQGRIRIPFPINVPGTGLGANQANM